MLYTQCWDDEDKKGSAMEHVQHMGSGDFIWPIVRDKWLELSELFYDYTPIGPDPKFLENWEGFWQTEEGGHSPKEKKFFLVKYYPLLRTAGSLAYKGQPVESLLCDLFQRYFYSQDTSSLTSIFKEQAYLIPSLIPVIEDITKKNFLFNLDGFFARYADKEIVVLDAQNKNQKTQIKKRFGLPYVISKLIEFTAEHLIKLHIKTHTNWMLKKMSVMEREYLSQGLLSYPKLFESTNLQSKFPKKPRCKKNNLLPTKKAEKAKKIIPSWMIAAYLHGRYSRDSFEWEERLVQKEKLKKDTYQALCDYIRTKQARLISHFKRVSYALYAQYFPSYLLQQVELALDLKNLGLNEFDLERIHSFYEKVQGYLGEEKPGLKGNKLLSYKIKLYLTYHGLEVTLLPGNIFSIASQGIQNLPSLTLSEEDNNDDFFLKSLQKSCHLGWSAIKKYGPLVAKVALVGAVLLKNPEFQGQDDSYPDFEHVWGQVMGHDREDPSESRHKKTTEISSIDEMLTQHFARYLYNMIEDYLAEQSPESLSPIEEKFPWLKDLQGSLKEQWEEYHYHLTFLQKENSQHNKTPSESQMLGYLSHALQCQPQWALLLLRHFKLRINDLEQAIQKSIESVLVRPVAALKKHDTVQYVSHRIFIDNFAAWRKNAHQCWHELSCNYITAWAGSKRDYRLSLPHLTQEQPYYTETIALVTSVTQPWNDLLAGSFSRQIAQALMQEADFLHRPIDMARLEYFLAFSDMNYEQQERLNDIDFENIQNSERVRIFFTALKYDINTIKIPQICDALTSYAAQDITFSHTITLAEQTTTEQFKKIYPLMGFRTARISLERMENNRVQALLLSWQQLSLLMRDENKLRGLLSENGAIAYAALRSLMRYCSDSLLVQLSAHRLIRPPADKTDAAAIEDLVITAYRHGLIKTARQILQKADEGFIIKNQHIINYAGVIEALSNPKSISTTSGIREQQIDIEAFNNFSLNELRTLLFQSAQAAIPALAQVILQNKKLAESPLSNTDYYLIFRSLRLSQAWAQHKQHYLAVIIETLSAQKLRQICFECYNRKPCLAQMLLDWSNAPQKQRGAYTQSDLLMQKILEAVLVDMPETGSAQKRLYPLSWSHTAQALSSLSSLKKYLLSPSFLMSLIKKRWYRSVAFIASFHQGNLSIEQMLPQYEYALNNKIPQKQYYQIFEEYLAHLIQEKVLSHSTEKMISSLYRYWKRIEYSPSLTFCLQVLQAVPSNDRIRWLKVFLKLCFLFDKNPGRRYYYWKELLTVAHYQSLRIHGRSFDNWIKKNRDPDIAAAYITASAQKQQQTFLEKLFPVQLNMIRPICQLAPLAYQARAFLYGEEKVFVYGHHIVLLQKYLQKYYQGNLEKEGTSLAARLEAQESMSLVMKHWLALYGANLAQIRLLRKKEKKERKQPSFQKQMGRYNKKEYLFQRNTEQLNSLGYLTAEESLECDVAKYCPRDVIFEALRPLVVEKWVFKGNKEIHFNPVRCLPPLENSPLCFSQARSEEKTPEADEQLLGSRERPLRFL